MTDREIVSLKEYMDNRFTELDKRLQVHFNLTDKALENANKALESRLEQLNEFRSQILEERQAYARKDEMDIKLSTLQKEVSMGTGRTAGKEWAIAIIFAVLFSLAGLIINIIK